MKSRQMIIKSLMIAAGLVLMPASIRMPNPAPLRLQLPPKIPRSAFPNYLWLDCNGGPFTTGPTNHQTCETAD
mgnify:CR=1 FL=1